MNLEKNLIIKVISNVKISRGLLDSFIYEYSNNCNLLISKTNFEALAFKFRNIMNWKFSFDEITLFWLYEIKDCINSIEEYFNMNKSLIVIKNELGDLIAELINELLLYSHYKLYDEYEFSYSIKNNNI